MAVTVLHLVRHAQPEKGEDVEDPPLSDIGIRQATALGERLRRVRDSARPALVAYNDGGHLTGSLRSDDPLQLER